MGQEESDRKVHHHCGSVIASQLFGIRRLIIPLARPRTARIRRASQRFATDLLPPIEQLLTVRQIAQFLGVCTATVYKWAATGVLPHVRIVNVIRVPRGDLIRFLTEFQTRSQLVEVLD